MIHQLVWIISVIWKNSYTDSTKILGNSGGTASASGLTIMALANQHIRDIGILMHKLCDTLRLLIAKNMHPVVSEKLYNFFVRIFYNIRKTQPFTSLIQGNIIKYKTQYMLRLIFQLWRKSIWIPLIRFVCGAKGKLLRFSILSMLWISIFITCFSSVSFSNYRTKNRDDTTPDPSNILRPK